MRRQILLLLGILAWACGAGAQEAPPSSAVSMAFVGDVMLDQTPGRLIRHGRDPFAPFAAILDSADLRIGNLECVVSDRGKSDPEKLYSFRAHPRVLKVLKRHLDAVSLANNHSGDYGPVAFGDMLDRLERSGIAYFGGGRNLAAAHVPLILERKGIRIALLGYNEFLPRWFEADDDKPGVAWSEDEQVRFDIAQARNAYKADIVIPMMHWGWENEPVANQRQRRLAQLMIEAGADAVVGGHPHVIQNIEIYRNKPIIYSLGNFVFDGFSNAANNTGWVLRMHVGKHGISSMETTVAHIDRAGIPHPGSKSQGLCWTSGQFSAAPCGGAGKPDSRISSKATRQLPCSSQLRDSRWPCHLE